jgi:hypothetical protein
MNFHCMNSFVLWITCFILLIHQSFVCESGASDGKAQRDAVYALVPWYLFLETVLGVKLDHMNKRYPY